MQEPNVFAVVTPDGVRVGSVSLQQVAWLRAADPAAEIFGGRHPAIYLQDADAWLTLERAFSIQDYLPDDYAHRAQSESGHRYWEMERPGRQPVGLCLPVNEPYRADTAPKRLPPRRTAPNDRHRFVRYAVHGVVRETLPSALPARTAPAEQTETRGPAGR